MSKNKNKYIEVLNIFFDGIKVYFISLDKFVLYMSFPVFGQVFGFLLLFSIVYFYTVSFSAAVSRIPVLDNLLVAFSLLLVFTIPVFFLLCKAIYDYIIAMASLNSMASSLTGKVRGRPKTFETKMHDEVVKRKLFTYIILLLLLSLAIIVGAFPLLWVVLLVFLIYESLAVQVFTLEDNLSPIEIMKRSFNLVKNNFWATTLLLILLGLSTYIFLPNLMVWALDKADVIYHLANPVEKFCALLPINTANELLASIPLVNYELEAYELARHFVISIISFIIIGYTLPLRSCCCTLWYKYLDSEKIEEIRKAGKLDGRNEIKKIIKKPKTSDNESN